MDLKGFNLRNLTLKDVRQCLENAGYMTTDKEFRLASDCELFKYIGCRDGQARYLVAFEDEDSPKEGNMFVTIIFVSVGASGCLVGDYAGGVSFESTDIHAIQEYIEERCN